MTHRDFDVLLERRLGLTRDTLAGKAKEYAAPLDRLHNFNQAAAMLRCTPAQALLGFLAKHLVSIVDMVNATGHTQPTDAQVDEKIGDAINYLILLESVFKDHIFRTAKPDEECVISGAPRAGERDAKRLQDLIQKVQAHPLSPTPPTPVKYTEDGIPRRCHLPSFTRAEKAIYDAQQAVEGAGCHYHLTDAMVHLGKARDRVADFVELPTEGK